MTQPFANGNRTQFAGGEEWTQVATRAPEIKTFDDYRGRLG
ncbi:hypothetical protein [Nocardioides sp. ChNu-153]|nr:hypothetical protein [Nocardioides sp. ChNu-153]